MPRARMGPFKFFSFMEYWDDFLPTVSQCWTSQAAGKLQFQRNCSRITSIGISVANIMEEYEDIKSEALSLYKSYKCNEEHLISNRLSHIRNFIKNSISDSQANAMCIEVALDEIQVRISLNPNKALDPDGLNGHFLRKA
ncbi:hypothetical protein L3X38_026709 [Prunus dulcis]|uniref:Uncharacterized protein n=1 Tax=Prunus dulcis TaxID=3755 RepID=A0AAD4VMS4_PRUDU|nr:hypothetical protein L3X38_026709 [Prunus dulcis]